jgi:phospholipase/lecithinase/hemolysin
MIRQILTIARKEIVDHAREVRSVGASGISIHLSHWGPFYDEVMHNPAKYGITDTTDACAGRAIFNQDTTPCSNPAAHYYHHSGHPSTAVHKIVGNMLYQEVLKLPAPKS